MNCQLLSSSEDTELTSAKDKPVESRGGQQPEPWSWCEHAALFFFFKSKATEQKMAPEITVEAVSEEGRWLDAKPVWGVLATAEMDKQSKLVLACWWPEGIHIHCGSWLEELPVSNRTGPVSAGPERLGGVCVQGEENEIQRVQS